MFEAPVQSQGEVCLRASRFPWSTVTPETALACWRTAPDLAPGLAKADKQLAPRRIHVRQGDPRRDCRALSTGYHGLHLLAQKPATGRWRDRVDVQHEDGRIGIIGRIPTDEEWAERYGGGGEPVLVVDNSP
jgi:hypothetical protein